MIFESTDDEVIQNKLNLILTTRIMQMLSERNWSLKRLSDESGIPYDSLKKLLSRRIHRPSFISVIKIAHALGCSVDALLIEENDTTDQ